MRKKTKIDTVDFSSYYKDAGIVCLTPKKNILLTLEKIVKEKFDINPDEFNQFIDENSLSAYTVPVLIPLMHNPKELLSYLQKHYKACLNIMMTAWSFPIEWWNFQDASLAYFEQLVDINYYPVLRNAINEPYTSLLNLSVTLANPTQEFMDYVITYLIKNESVSRENDMTNLKFLTSLGIAIISNTLEKQPNQNLIEWLTITSDSKNFLSALENKILATLFSIYFRDETDWPKETDDFFLNRWFNTKTLSGIYLISSDSSSSV